MRAMPNQMERFIWYFGVEKPLVCRLSHLWQTPEMIAAAAECGTLSVLSAGFMSANEIRNWVGKIRTLTTKPFAVEIFPPQKGKLDENAFALQLQALRPLREDLELKDPSLGNIDFEEQFQTLLDLDIPIVGVSLGGLREPYMEALEAKGTKIYGVSTNLRDSKVLVASGVKAIIAQGWGAPGLRSFCEAKETASNIDSLTLFSELNRALKIPFAAEGCCLNKEEVKASICLGASAIVLSDALIKAQESTFPRQWREKFSYFSDGASDVNSLAMGRASRSLRTGILETIEENELPVLEFPFQWFALKDIFEKAVAEDMMELAYIEMGQSSYQAKEGKTEEIINEVWEWINSNE